MQIAMHVSSMRPPETRSNAYISRVPDPGENISSFLDVRAVPAYFAVLSATTLVLNLTLTWYRSRKSSAIDPQSDSPPSDPTLEAGAAPARNSPSAFNLLKLLATTLLFILAVITSVWGPSDRHDFVHLATPCSVAYAAALSFLAIFPSASVSAPSGHATFVLQAVFGTYAYRNIWPLMTFTLTPADAAEGGLLWAKVFLSALGAVVLPLFEPYPYIPLDPSKPEAVANPEQTASIASWLLYAYVDPRAAIPPLADADATTHLIATAYPHIDPFSGAGRRGNLFWGLMWAFRSSVFWQALVIVCDGSFRFLLPIGTNRLLRYLETGGEGALVRPWAWVLLITIGGIFAPSITNQMYFFLAENTLARVQALLNALVFDHALRLRVLAGGSTHAGGQDHNNADTGVDAAKGNDGLATQEPGLVGKINDLVSSDLDNVFGASEFMIALVDVPTEFILGIAFLYAVLGISALIGLVVMIVLFPVPALISAWTARLQAAKMSATDERVDTITEVLSVMRMVKLFALEGVVVADIAEKRGKELAISWRLKLVEATNMVATQGIPILYLIVCYASYALLFQQELTASIVFSTMSAFALVQQQVSVAAHMMPKLVRAFVSLRRIQEFLTETELLDEFAALHADKPDLAAISSAEREHKIGFGRATFTWSAETARERADEAERTFRLVIEEDLLFQRGTLNMIVGPTGCGKTSLLFALLGELHFVQTASDGWYHLPRACGVAYAAQESWVLNDTIRNNIVFGAPWDAIRYAKVVGQCGLERDLALFQAGDETEVGEKGLTLSGGQKARVTLARAVYSSAEILLLDDVLAALDVHTSRWIVNKCLKGDLLEGRTVLLVTHNLALVEPIAQFVVAMTSDGRVASQGSLADALASIEGLGEELEHEQAVLDTDIAESKLQEKTTKKPDGKLILKEEVEEGAISMDAWKLFFRAMGGRWPVLFWMTAIGGQLLHEAVAAAGTWTLGVWAQQYLRLPSSEVNVFYYLGVYSILSVLNLLGFVQGSAIYAWGSIRASRTIHQTLLSSLMGTTFRWLDITPVSRSVARCTQDIQAVDGALVQNIVWVFDILAMMTIYLGAITIITPILLFPGIILGVLGCILGSFYLRKQLPIKREQSVARAPMLAIFDSAISGLVTIRAYRAQAIFRAESHRRTDRYTRATRWFVALSKWVAIRMDALATLFVTGVLVYLLYGPTGKTPSEIGFSVNMAFQFSMIVLWLLLNVNGAQVQGNSLERINAFLKAEQEPKPTLSGQPSSHWPSSGALSVENLSARYSKDGPDVLHDLSFSIAAGERVGVVGRTGSGKSTLTLALLRAMPTTGNVIFDGLPTATINLDALRSNIAFIPQVPELLRGTLRHTLDVRGEHDDSELNDALHAAGLFTLKSKERQLSLDSAIGAGGGNLSIGERQVIALARAMVRRSKLLILDEATSAIDAATDTAIQASLRQELGRDVTVLVVAHRLQTIIDYDKIIVLDAGRLVEFASPQELLRKEGSFFKAMVDQSADREILYAMAAC